MSESGTVEGISYDTVDGLRYDRGEERKREMG